jgi:microcystin-dependent protein
MSDQFLGEIRMTGFNFAPYGWALCNGQTMSISQNTALFSLIGTYYGGDGISTFQLPNLQSRVPIHQGQGPGLSPYVLGQNGGFENVTLSTQQMPQHNHLANTVSGPQATAPRPSNAYPGNATSGSVYSTGTPDSTFNNNFISYQGNSQPHNNLQPYLCISFCIALQGIYPSRN